MSDRARDDAIVLAALPSEFFEIVRRFAEGPYRQEVQFGGVDVAYATTERALRRLKRANLARYVRETKRWEKVI